MRLVIDLQGAQSRSRHRGIGRYSLALAQAMAMRAGGHEVWIALNDAFPETIESLRAVFDGLIPQDRIVVWQVPTPVRALDQGNVWRRQTGEILRESFLASLKPDIIHVSSLFDGYFDEAIASAGSFTGGRETAITLFDFIPLLHQSDYLPDRAMRTWYYNKLGSMRRAGLWLAISESSRREGIDLLNLPAEKVVNISTAADTRFRPIRLSEESESSIRKRYGLVRPFVMYTGATDPRKNLDRLFTAYSSLPANIRQQHQLLVTCPAVDFEVATLKQEAQRRGIGANELVVAPFVSDDDLVALYNLCTVFCFPSVHEGFGLPALEAMQSGAAVIGSNRSSIPEVIGRPDALFDPFDEQDIAARLSRVLTDSDYRHSLKKHGLEQALKFSWAESARRAWIAFEEHNEESKALEPRFSIAGPRKRPRLAYVSPLPPERSGIADYSAELIPELTRHYDVDVVVDQPEVSDLEVIANCPVRESDWFAANALSYDRILYHFGNSPFHKHMFNLLDRFPGTVVLHDFYLSSVAFHLERHLNWRGFWTNLLYSSHGYGAMSERLHADDLSNAVANYPVNLTVLQNAHGIIVHSEHSLKLARSSYGGSLTDDWRIIPLARRLPHGENRHLARKSLGFGERDFVLCSFGMIAPTKLNRRLLEAWLESKLARNPDCYLVFVGAMDGNEYGADLGRMIASSPFRDRIKVTGFAADEVYRQHLRAADGAVQLRTLSRGETSAAVLDCMAHALPTIVNRHGSLAELPESGVAMLPDEFTDEELVSAIESLWTEPERRRALGGHARSYVQKNHSPRLVADRYREAIEHFHSESYEALKQRTIAATASVDPTYANEEDWLALSRAMNRNLPIRSDRRQLLLDVSGLVQHDLKTGIERVARSVLKAFLDNAPPGFRVEPVYATSNQPGYRYARNFTSRFLGCPTDLLEDAPVEVRRGDVFVGLDLQHYLVLANTEFYADLRRQGVGINFVVYDLLPVLLPHAFPDGTADLHAHWLSVLGTYADNLICISRSVADEVADWLGANRIERKRPLRLQWFHLGSDIEKSVATKGIPHQARETLAAISARSSFLMVGTIEPRKGYSQTLEAFEQLWRDGKDVNLVIVGAEGWKHLSSNQRGAIPELVKKLRSHPELGKRLFWLEGISDEFLEKIYAESRCLIAASEGEGFGLPLIEAARHKIPILARDIPVFQEVAGEHASYFSGMKPEDIARAIVDWLARYKRGEHRRSEGLPWQNWADSVEQFSEALFGDTAYRTWPRTEQIALKHDDLKPQSSKGMKATASRRRSRANQA